MRILIFGDGAWATKTILRLTECNKNIVGLIIRSRPSDSSLPETANRLAIPVFQPKNVNSPEFVERVKGLAPDISLSISYDQILRAPVLDVASLGSLNVHAGRLPFYRGRNVVNWAIINGESEIGLTVHFMDEGIDTGDIVRQTTLPINWRDTYAEVLDRVVEAVPGLAVEAIDLVASGGVHRQRQSEMTGTYFCSRGDGDEWLDWSDSSLNLYNKVRAISRPGPGARTLLKDRVVIVWRAGYDPAWPNYIATPGQVVGRTMNGVLVKTGDSILLLEETQTDPNPCETPSWAIGTRLGLDLYSLVRSLQARIQELESQLAQSGNKHGASSTR